jgi:hypothetical protein
MGSQSLGNRQDWIFGGKYHGGLYYICHTSAAACFFLIFSQPTSQVVGELANLTQEKMTKRSRQKTEPHMCLESSLHEVISTVDHQNITVMFKILRWWLKYYCDAPDITVMFKISRWWSKYYSSALDITVMFKISRWWSKYYSVS